jgi:hypothetical protein
MPEHFVNAKGTSVIEFEFDLKPELIGKEQATAYLDAKIELLRAMVVDRPRPPLTDNLSQPLIQGWIRRFLSHYGKVLGNIEYAVNRGDISRSHSEKLESGIKLMINYHVSTVIIGR